MYLTDARAPGCEAAAAARLTTHQAAGNSASRSPSLPRRRRHRGERRSDDGEAARPPRRTAPRRRGARETSTSARRIPTWDDEAEGREVGVLTLNAEPCIVTQRERPSAPIAPIFPSRAPLWTPNGRVLRAVHVPTRAGKLVEAHTPDELRVVRHDPGRRCRSPYARRTITLGEVGDVTANVAAIRLEDRRSDTRRAGQGRGT